MGVLLRSLIRGSLRWLARGLLLVAVLAVASAFCARIAPIDAQGRTERAAFWAELATEYGFELARLRGSVPDTLVGEVRAEGTWYAYSRPGDLTLVVRERSGTLERRAQGMTGWMPGGVPLDGVIGEPPLRMAARLLRLARNPIASSEDPARLTARIPCAALDPNAETASADLLRGDCTLRYSIDATHRLQSLDVIVSRSVEGTAMAARLRILPLGQRTLEAELAP